MSSTSTSRRNKMSKYREVCDSVYFIDVVDDGRRILTAPIALLDPLAVASGTPCSMLLTALIINDVPDDVVFASIDEAIFLVEQNPEPTKDDYLTAWCGALTAVGAIDDNTGIACSRRSRTT